MRPLTLEAVAALESEPVRVGGLEGFETVAEAKDRASGRPRLVYQLVLFEGGRYHLMRGLVSRRRAAEHLPSFKAMARTFRRR